jgi:hypothetical protein
MALIRFVRRLFHLFLLLLSSSLGSTDSSPTVPTDPVDDHTMIASLRSRCSGCLHSLRTALPSIVLGILSVVLVALALQLQYVSYELSTVKQQIHNLQDSLHNQTQTQIADLSTKVEQEHSLTLYQMAGTVCMLTCLLTMFHMSSHLRRFREPLIQRKVVALLWMSPIYSLTSFLSLIMPQANGYLAIVREFYEGT